MSVSQGSVKAGMVVPQRRFVELVIVIFAQAAMEQSVLLTKHSQGAVKFNPVTLILQQGLIKEEGNHSHSFMDCRAYLAR
jgi:hypothetical protein